MSRWDVGPSPDDVRYHGLFNQGATCYLNSVLQVLFMTRDFREAVERYAPDNPDTECIDRQLKAVFESLQTETAWTYEITEKLGIDNVYEQRDAAEYFERILALASPEASQIFHGEVTRTITCCCCKTVMNTDGKFLHLPLELVDVYRQHRVEDGIKEYFRTSHFNGENQMYCEECNAKSDATIECAMKDHPDVLMLLLKRFDFDYGYMSYVKNNNVVEFPRTLQLRQNQTYEVYAYVEHAGDLRSGHYTAMIKSQENGTWYRFTDDSVYLRYDQPFQHGDAERSESVYLLFYRKKKRDEDECPDVEQTREQEEREKMAEVHKEETSTEDNVSDGSAGVDPISNVEDPDRIGIRQEPLSDLVHDGEVMMEEEEEGGKSKECEDQAGTGSGLLPTEAQLEGKEDYMDFCDAEMDDASQGRADIYQGLKPGDRNRDTMHEAVMGYEGSENNNCIEMTNEEEEEGESVQDQDKGMLEDVGQDGPEEEIGVPHHTTHEEVGGVGQAKESTDSSQSVMEKPREKQGGEGVEKLGNPQPTERAGCKDATAEGGGGSEKTKLGRTKSQQRDFHDDRILLLDDQPCETSKIEKSQNVHLPNRKEKTAGSREVISAQLLPVETQLAKFKEDQNRERGKQNPQDGWGQRVNKRTKETKKRKKFCGWFPFGKGGKSAENEEPQSTRKQPKKPKKKKKTQGCLPFLKRI